MVLLYGLCTANARDPSQLALLLTTVVFRSLPTDRLIWIYVMRARLSCSSITVGHCARIAEANASILLILRVSLRPASFI
jgi:hypothetical protein